MKQNKTISKTLLFAGFTLVVILVIYIFDYRAGEHKEKMQQGFILNNDPAQINYIQIIKPDVKIALQKNPSGWALLEPIQDSGNSDNIEDFLDTLSKARQISVVKESEMALTDADLREFGLEKPAAVFNFKNNLGQTKIISVGSVKNFEGNSYIHIDSENKIIIAEPVWFSKSQNGLIHYREVKLYRHSLANVTKVKVKSLRDDFEFKLIDGKWFSTQQNYELDQNKVREILRKISATNIVEYVFEGEPSAGLVKEKGLDKEVVNLKLETDSSTWSATININPDDKALYALTERPTFLVKIDLDAWELFGNLALDQLRDRTSALSFKPEEVQKIFFRQNNSELNIISSAGSWKNNESTPSNSELNLNIEQIKRTINKIHDLKISEFVDNPIDKGKFEGKSMLILKTDKEKLVLQLNWGPAFKITKDGNETEYYYARTHLSDSIFALEKKLIDSLDFDKIFIAKKSVTPQANEKSGEQVDL